MPLVRNWTASHTASVWAPLYQKHLLSNEGSLMTESGMCILWKALWLGLQGKEMPMLF